MNRIAIVASSLSVLFASACLGEITGGEDDKDPPVQPEPEPVTDVKLTVRDGTKLQQGVKVLFLGTDDSLIAEATTDAMGIATAKMPSGGNVTVIRTYGPNSYGEPGPIDHLFTYTGVKPGDVIELVGTLRDETPLDATVNLPLTNGEFIYIQTPCGVGYGHAPAIPVSFKGCGDETDFFVVNYSGETDPNDGTNSGPLYYSGRIKLAPTIDLSTAEFRGTLSTEYSATNMGMETLYLQKRLVTADAFTVFDTGPIQVSTQTVEIPELPSTEQIVTAHVSSGETVQQISQRAAFSSAPTTIDVAANLIKTSSALAYANNSVTWTEAGTGAPDLTLATITVGAVDRQFAHTIAGAYTGASLRVPVLPVAKYNVQTTDTPRIDHSLVRVTGGYEAVRSMVFNRAYSDIAPMGGSATATYASVQPTDQKL